MVQNGKVTAFFLKIIATISMFIDHFAFASRTMLSSEVYRNLRHIGRVGFPIYCFLLVEGYKHTSSKSRYLVSLIILAVISEYPYDTFFYSWEQRQFGMNVVVTLATGLCLIWVSETFLAAYSKRKAELLSFCAFICASLMAERVNMTYGWFGIFLIYLIYVFDKIKCVKIPKLWSAFAIMMWCILYDIDAKRLVEIYGILSCIPIMAYYGDKGGIGINPKLEKWAFYLFYPLHLIVLKAL